MIAVDCHPSADARTAARQHDEWQAHLEQAYTRRDAIGYLRAWAKEDVYVPLDAELDLMRRNRLRPDVVWRKNAFAVIVAR
jgi:hypothetical protein